MNLSITEEFLPVQNKLSYKKQKHNYNPFSQNQSANTSAPSVTNYTVNSQLTNIKNTPNSATPSFAGITPDVHNYVAKSIDDMMHYWHRFIHQSYVGSPTKQDKLLYSGFLNDVPFKVKGEFVERFKEITGFPDFKKVAQKIENEFIKTIKAAVNASQKRYSTAVKIIAAGYDPTCAVGLGKAFPGSCLRNPFIVYDCKKPSFFSPHWQFSGSDMVELQFRDFFRDETDQRILEVEFNKLDGMPHLPQMFLMKDLPKRLKFFDKYDSKIDADVGYALDWLKSYIFCDLKDKKLDPVEGALYNIKLSKLFPNSEPADIPTKEKRSRAKYLATFIESIRDGKYLIKDEDSMFDLKNIIDSSPFASYSNITQIKARKNLIAQGDFSFLPEKFSHREKLEKEFNKMSTEDQFDLVKEIIKASYGIADNPKYIKYFKNDENLARQYKKLDRAILGGIVDEDYI